MIEPRTLSLGARALVIALAAAGLFASLWSGARAPVHLLLVLDDSASMAPAAVDQAWSSLFPVLLGLPPGSRLSLVRMGADAAIEVSGLELDDPQARAGLDPERPPRRLPILDTGTAIGAALGLALAQLDPNESGLLLLVSDGVETQRQPGPAWHERPAHPGVPLLWWSPSQGAEPADAWVAALDTRLAADRTLVARVRVAANRPLDATLTLGWGDGPLMKQPLSLDGRVPLDLELNLGAPPSGTPELTAQVIALGDERPGNDRRGVTLEPGRTPSPCLLSRDPGASPVAQGLAAGGWNLTLGSPETFPFARLGDCSVLILDGLRAPDLSPQTWRTIERAVSFHGQGLMVLGGPDTFAGGGYRHSRLESLLPVTAEVPERVQAAAVLFAVDESGSMAQPLPSGLSRLDLARQAVSASAAALAPTDTSGLLVFHAEPHLLLPLARHQDPVQAMKDAWRPNPGGGTRLEPAIDQALDLLPAGLAPQRLLVLVSDGQVADPQTAAPLGAALAAAGIEVLGMALGDQPQDSPLSALVQAAGGTLRQVGNLAELPALMQAEVERRRHPIEPGPLIPRLVAPLPLGETPAEPWPEVLAYPATRARDGAQVQVTAPNGDPLLAAHHAGAGRVLALPAGIGAWTPDWPGWPPWGSVLRDLIRWAGGVGRPLDARLEPGPGGGARILVDLAGEDGRWSEREHLGLRVRDPDGAWVSLVASALAPGQYLAELTRAPRGHYLIQGDGVRQARGLWYDPGLEFAPTAQGSDGAQPPPSPWWTGREVPPDLPLPRRRGDLPTAWILAALVVFLALLIWENLGHRLKRLSASRLSIGSFFIHRRRQRLP